MSTFLRATATAAWLIGLLAPAAVGADDLPASGVRLGSTRLRHAAVWLAWAPDGKTFASVGRDGAIRVWDSADGKQLHEYKVQGVSFHSVVFDPEAKCLLASDVVGAAHVLDAATGAESHLLHSSPQQIVALAWRPDGSVATLVRGGILRVWDLKTDKVVGQSGDPPKPGAFTTEALAADGGRCAVWARDENRLKAWEADGKELFQAQLPPVPFANYLAFSTDGKTLAVYGSTGQVALWDVDAGKEARRLDGVSVYDESLVFSPNGRYLIGRPGAGAAVHMWGAVSGKDLREFDLPPGLPSNGGGKTVALSPDGKRLIAARGSAIHVWNVETCAELPGFVGHNAPVIGICFSADGRSVFTHGQDGAIGQWDAATGQRLAWRLRPESGLLLPWPTPDGKIGVISREGRYRRWGPDDKLEDAPPFTGVESVGAQWVTSADGAKAAGRGREASLRIWDAESGKEQAVVKPDQPPTLLTFALSPDGRLLAIGSANSATRLYDAATGAAIRWFGADPAAPGAPAPPAGQATTLFFAPDGRALASVFGKDLTLWETATGRVRVHTTWPGAAAGRLAFSPDGTLLAAATATGSAALLGTADGKVLTELPGDIGLVRSLAFSPDGKALATGGEDGGGLIWDVKDYTKGKSTEVPAERLTALWDDLQDGDAAHAYQAILALAASPKAAAPFLKERATSKPADERRITQLITDLDDNSFDVRENAQKELEALGPVTFPKVKQVLDASPSAEARQRLQHVLSKHQGAVTEEVRGLRAVEALERSGAPEAVEALRALAKDAPNAAIKRAAQEAMARKERRVGP